MFCIINKLALQIYLASWELPKFIGKCGQTNCDLLHFSNDASDLELTCSDNLKLSFHIKKTC
jgi:hypothetical protein